jgi:CDGSH-type Zn-finger protein
MTSTKIEPEDKTKTGMKIKVSQNGPYQVSGGIPLSEQAYTSDNQGLSTGYQETKQYPPQDYYELCRCGRSKTKPFCDKTHEHTHFDGTETASHGDFMDQAEPKTVGPELELVDIPILCASARFCDRAGGVWDNTRQSDDPAAKQVVIDEVGYCPAGRLLVYNKARHAIEPELEPSIVLIEDPIVGVDGPIWVRGGITIEAADGTLYHTRNRVTLCRCGRSHNKPFCDGRHVDV